MGTVQICFGLEFRFEGDEVADAQIGSGCVRSAGDQRKLHPSAGTRDIFVRGSFEPSPNDLGGNVF